MGNTVTIAFRAKRDNYCDDEFRMRPGYRVPALTGKHVKFSERDTFAVLFFSCRDADITLGRVRRMGVPRVVFADAPGEWVVSPIGDGFMADVSVSFEIDRKGCREDFSPAAGRLVGGAA